MHKSKFFVTYDMGKKKKRSLNTEKVKETLHTKCITAYSHVCIQNKNVAEKALAACTVLTSLTGEIKLFTKI